MNREGASRDMPSTEQPSTEIEPNREAVFTYHVGRYGIVALALAALVADCYEEVRPVDGILYASTALRTSSVTIVTLLATDEGYAYFDPSVVTRRWSRTRVLLSAIALIIVNMNSSRQGVPSVRATEALFMVVVFLLALVLPLSTGGTYLILTRLGKKIRTSDPSLTVAFSVLAYVGARLIRNGLKMCPEAIDQIQNPSFGLEDLLNAAETRKLCVACSGWAAVSVAVSGGALFFCSLGSMFVLNNHAQEPVSENSVSDVMKQQRDLNGLLRLCLGIYAAALLSSFMALADCVGNTESTYERYECSIGGEPDCPDQLVEFRRLGFVQHSIGTNTFAFVAIVALSLRVEKDLCYLQGQRDLVSRSGVPMACGIILCLLIARVSVAGWETEGFIELSFIIVLVGTALTSIYYTRSMIAATVIYIGLLIDYTYYCNEYGECRSFRYLTNVSNMLMGIMFLTILLIDILMRLWECFNGEYVENAVARYLRAFVGILSLVGLSIALCLALLVTAALAAYDGSNVDEVVVPMTSLTNAGMSEQQSVIRFIIWHYAPLVAWASLRQRLVMHHESILHKYWDRQTQMNVQVGKQYNAMEWPWDSSLVLFRTPNVRLIRIAAWVVAILLDLALWISYKSTSLKDTETPTAYPMSQVVMLTITVIPPWFLLTV